jgi:hypothetical protein
MVKKSSYSKRGNVKHTHEETVPYTSNDNIVGNAVGSNGQSDSPLLRFKGISKNTKMMTPEQRRKLLDEFIENKSALSKTISEKSRLTEKDALELGRKINRSLHKSVAD